MAKHLSVDLYALRESLIRGDLRDEFERSARRKVDVAEAPLELADHRELEQMMHRTWYETALVLTPADNEERIQHALQVRYISLRARWQRYWTMHQARGGEDGCPRSVQLFYDLVSDLKSTYLVSIAKALGNDVAMSLWRRCDQFTQRLNQHLKRDEAKPAALLARLGEQARAARRGAGERCTAWPPLVLDTFDQLERLAAVSEALVEFHGQHASAGTLATALFALDNEALLRGAGEALAWQGAEHADPARTLLRGFQAALDVILDPSLNVQELFDLPRRSAA